jgi:hypothetical protein
MEYKEHLGVTINTGINQDIYEEINHEFHAALSNKYRNIMIYT